MSYQYNICKGAACALNLTPEYKEGQFSLPRSENPYDFWDEYTKHYAWDIGNQASCKVPEVSSRVCEFGTKGCIIIHGA